ncbi:hypothetical protein [Streptomyces sp. WM6372]|nr:hypothetical protein [Streptomyces sp. WM6372]
MFPTPRSPGANTPATVLLPPSVQGGDTVLDPRGVMNCRPFTVA